MRRQVNSTSYVMILINLSSATSTGMEDLRRRWRTYIGMSSVTAVVDIADSAIEASLATVL